MTRLADALTFRAHLGDPHVHADYLGRPGVLRTGHFELLSGLHTQHFLAFSRIAIDKGAVDDLADTLSALAAAWSPTAVLAPSTAGVALAGALAGRIGVPLLLAALDDGGRADGILGAPDLTGGRVLLVNDVVTTGDGLEALATVVKAARGDVAGAAWFASRADIDVSARLGVPVAHLVSVDLPAFPADQCPGCTAGTPAQPALDLN